MRNWLSWHWPEMVLISISVLVVAAIGSFVWKDSKKPTFELKKDEWNCTASHSYTYTTMLSVGKAMIPQTHVGTACDKYERIQ